MSPTPAPPGFGPDRTPLPADEAGHPAGEDGLWNESWYFDFAADDGAVGGYARLGLCPALGVAWWWGCLVRAGQPLLAIRHHEVDLPRGDTLEIRADGLWAALHCETPLDHWTVGMETFAVALDDPLDALGDERGQPTPLGFDLEWETAGPGYAYPGVTRYELSCRVTGEVLVGTDRLVVDGWGQRDHSWGPRDWWTFPWTWTAGRLDDGTAFHASRPELAGVDYHPGYVAAPGGTVETDRFDVETVFGPDGLPEAARFGLRHLDLQVSPRHHAPVRLEAPDGRVGCLLRALCRFDAGDGRRGWGWGEWNRPPA